MHCYYEKSISMHSQNVFHFILMLVSRFARAQVCVDFQLHKMYPSLEDMCHTVLHSAMQFSRKIFKIKFINPKQLKILCVYGAQNISIYSTKYIKMWIPLDKMPQSVNNENF